MGRRGSIGDLLERELQRLKEATEFGQELSVKWLPGSSSGLEGEVKGGTVFVYSPEAPSALATLRHEFIDYVVSRAIEPYRRTTVLYKAMVNAVVEQLGKEAYEEKEKAIDALRRLLAGGHPQEGPQ